MSSEFYTRSGFFAKIIANNVSSNDKDIFVDDSALSISSANIPTREDSPGVSGDIAFDSNYLYICANENKWKYTELMVPCVAPEWSQGSEEIDVVQGNYNVNYQSTLSENECASTFSVDENSANVFFIDSSTGELFFKEAPDFNTGPFIYTVTIIAKNKAGSKNLVLTINIIQ